MPFLQISIKAFAFRDTVHHRVSQLGSTSGGTIWTNGQKLHENDKIGIFGSKQWGRPWGGDKPIFRVVGGDPPPPQSPATRGNPAS